MKFHKQSLSKSLRTAGTLSLAAMLGMAAGMAGAIEPGNVPRQEEYAPLGMLLDGNGGRPAPGTVSLLRQMLNDNRNQGAWSGLDGREVVLMSPEQAGASALEKNLSLLKETRNLEQTAQAVEQAKAVFKPTFQVSVGATETVTYDRFRYGTIYVKDVVSVGARTSGGAADPMYTLQIDEVITQDPAAATVYRMGLVQLPEDHPRYYLNFNPALPDEFVIGENGDKTYDRNYLVSAAKKVGSDVEVAGSVTISQILPWGPVLSLTHGLSWASGEESHTTKGEYPGVYESDPHALDGYWAGNISFNVWLPLPGSKNYGRYNTNNANVMQAEITHRMSDWILKGAINSTLLQVEVAYWELVRSVEKLLVATENRRFTQYQVTRSQRMFDSGRVNKLGLAQVQAEDARAQVLEEQARQTVLQASNRLANLVENDPQRARGMLILPSGFQHRMGLPPVVQLENAVNVALNNRPEIQTSNLNVESKDVDVRVYENQARWDVSTNLSYGESQDNSLYGYENPRPVYDNMLNGDVRTYNASLAINRGFQNRAPRAALARAREGKNSAKLLQESAEDNIVKEVSDAVATLTTARSRVRIAGQSQKLAQESLAKAQKLRHSLGTVGELEIILKLRELVNARNGQVNALLDSRIAHARLLAAQGTLPVAFSQKQAQGNPLENMRIQRLQESGQVGYFSPATVAVTDQR